MAQPIRAFAKSRQVTVVQRRLHPRDKRNGLGHQAALDALKYLKDSDRKVVTEDED